MTVDETIAKIRKFDAAIRKLKEMNNCPKCGAPEATIKNNKWQCGTKKALCWVLPPEENRFVGRRTKKCFEREIKNLEARLGEQNPTELGSLVAMGQHHAGRVEILVEVNGWATVPKTPNVKVLLLEAEQDRQLDD